MECYYVFRTENKFKKTNYNKMTFLWKRKTFNKLQKITKRIANYKTTIANKM